MKKKEDLRTVRTKTKLKKAFETLLKTNTFEKITVSDICNEAGVNRVTFYTHYEDKYNLFEDILHEIVEIINRTAKENTIISLNPRETFINFVNEMLKAIIEICYQSREIISAFGNQENSMLVSMIEHIALTQGGKYMKEIEQKTKVQSKYPTDFILTFLVSGFGKLMFEWIRNPNKLSKEEFLTHSKTIATDLVSSNLIFEIKK